ncbi:MAG: TIGR03621 family F420-dependent LLM class oxidoreductase, partial [Actinobacteria bacterium]|nr:TIGR03621 family F420-dependent LLM class oxidoreductase [Actinomycetota bacterium]
MSSSHPRRFRFGVEMLGPFDGMTWADSARHLEQLGYSTLFVPDHFHNGLGPITAMATAAMATTELVVAPMVLACDFRHPAVLARELASIDLLSGGRLEVGLGAGYNPLDYRRSGIQHDPPGVRVDRLIEHTTVLRALFDDGPVTFAGQHYRIDDLESTPKPARAGGPPIIIAGGGRRLLTFAAPQADIIGVNPSLPAAPDASTVADALPDAIDRKFELIRSVAGPRFDSLEFTSWTSFAAITDDETALRDRLRARFGDADQALQSPIVLAGTVGQVVDELERRRERWGYSYIALQSGQTEAFAPVVARLAGR